MGSVKMRFRMRCAVFTNALGFPVVQSRAQMVPPPLLKLELLFN